MTGAAPKVWIKPEVNRQEFVNQNIDIAGSTSRQLHFGLNKPEYNLNNKDIEKSWPHWNKFVTTRSPTNPLNPVYTLSKVEYVPPEPVKFIRDQMNVDDLEGARPK